MKKQNAITLIALVITIVVLLILAGISISALTNQGLFEKAKEAKQKSEDAQKNESAILENYLAQMNAIIFSNINKNETNPEAAMPKGAIVIEGDANKGIVIKDNNDNEWVWVEVPKTIYEKSVTETDYDEIYNALDTYATVYRKGSDKQNLNWKDEWYEGCGIETSQKYTEMYNKMLSSVFINGGFWISRYEIGDSTATLNNTTRTSDSGTKGTPVSKQNQIPYNYVTCSQAQNLSSGLSTDSNKTSSLLFGIQWDLVCKFLEEKTDLTNTDINSDSTSWGNFKNSSLKLYRGKYNTTPDNSTSEWISYVKNLETSSDVDYMQLLTTGASEQTNKMNIYDFAGNEWEWTLEHANSDARYLSAFRGGCFNSSGSSRPVSHRGNDNANDSIFYLSFRSTLYQ